MININNLTNYPYQITTASTKSVLHQAVSDDEKHRVIAILQHDSLLMSSMSTNIETTKSDDGQIKALVHYNAEINKYYYRAKVIKADHDCVAKMVVFDNNQYNVISNTIVIHKATNQWIEGIFDINNWKSTYDPNNVRLIIYGGDGETTFGKIDLEQQSLTTARYDYLTAPFEKINNFKYMGYYYDELEQPSCYAQSYIWSNQSFKGKGLILGDSLAAGIAGWYDGGVIVSNILMQDYLIYHTVYDWENAAIGGTELFYGENSMIEVMRRYNFANYQQLIIMYGTNDFNLGHETLNDVKDALDKLNDKINRENPDIKLMVVTPIMTFDRTSDPNQINRRGFSQNQLIDTMINTVKGTYNYLDWRDNPIVTQDNYWYTLGDGIIHPTSITYLKMFRRILRKLNDEGD